MNRRLPYVALALSGIFWGSTAPLTKLALEVLDPGSLTATRFVLASVPLLWVARRNLRQAARPGVLAAGAIGYGVVVALWNEGLARTSVSHGALMAGAVPALVALIALAAGRGTAHPRAWAGFGLALAGVVLVAAGGGRASVGGDLVVLASMLLSAGFTVRQVDLLAGRDPVAVTAVQFVAAAVVTLPLALLTGGGRGPGFTAAGAGPWLAVLALVLAGTVAPFTLFAWGQARTTPEVAGAFLPLEPVVGAAVGALAFGDPFGGSQLAGATAVLGGIALSALPAGRAGRAGTVSRRPWGRRRWRRGPVPRRRCA